MKCILCSLDSTFALCAHGACAACRVLGDCDGCKEDIALYSLTPAQSISWVWYFNLGLDDAMPYADACRFAWASVRTDYPELRGS